VPITKIASCRRQMAGLQPNLHTMVPRCACIQDVLKVKVKVKGHVIRALLCRSRKSLLVAGKWPDCNQTCTRWSPRCACIQDVLKVKVKVKGHVLGAVLCWHEKRFSSEGNGQIATKLAHDGLQVKVKVKGHVIRAFLVLDLKSLFLAGKWLD